MNQHRLRLQRVFFMATALEASEFIKKSSLQSEPLEHSCQQLPDTWHFILPETLLILTGVGPYSAHIAVEKYIDFFGIDAIRQHTWINIGIAGAASVDQSNRPYSLGTWADISSVSLLDWHPQQGYSQSSIGLPIDLNTQKLQTTQRQDKWPLLTSPLPVYETEELLKKMRATGYSHFLIDMEAYAVAALAKKHGIELQIHKIVSDFCTAKSSSEIRKNIAYLTSEIANYAWQLI